MLSPPDCQIKGLEQISEPLGKIEAAWQLQYKIKRVLKRRFRFIRNWLSRPGSAAYTTTGTGKIASSQPFMAGQSVRVKPREEIQATLDNWSYLKGCAFMEEMWAYCGTNQRILKPVNKFVDERDHRLKKTRGIVFLEGVHCEGTIDYGRCDRNCYFFWREEWLEEVE